MMLRRRNIFLTGMMGTGKSTAGKQLAEMLGMKFIDTDEQIETVTGMSIKEIFKKLGEKRFRDIESTYFREKALEDNQVFSTGGGIVLRKENRNVLKNKGFTILLRVQPRSLSERIGTSSTRPLLRSAENVEERLSGIWYDRKTYYESTADLIIDADDLDPEYVVKTITDFLGKTDEEN